MKLFDRVHCRGYMKVVKDGVRIQLYNSDGSFCSENTVTDLQAKAIAYKTVYDDKGVPYESELEDLSEFCGQSVDKTYRERVEDSFNGVLVGITRVKVKGIIGTDWNDNHYGSEFGFCFREITENPKVGVVYFKNNCKRYVLLDDIERAA